MVKSIEISDFDSPGMYPMKSDRQQWEMVDIWCYAHQFGIATCTGTKEKKKSRNSARYNSFFCEPITFVFILDSTMRVLIITNQKNPATLLHVILNIITDQTLKML